ncbi:MAG: response regulator, partial [Dehalococcoidales bacterium]|nr:response regulator [Dehalococcoidales bacterium]
MGKSKILIVDDEPVQLHMMEQVLRARGFEVIKAGNGHEAMRLFLENHPDLVILDVMMPEIDGFQFRKILLENDKYKDIPFVFLTSKSDEDDMLSEYALSITDS